LADWPTRALGLLVDAIFWVVPWFVLFIIEVVSGVFIIGLLGWLLWIGLFLFFGTQVGQYGSTPGMRTIGLRCVSIKDGQLIGTTNGIVRALAHFVDGIICFVGWLFPLWDAQKQTIADKLMGTIVIKVPAEGFSITPKAK
jgi:uncharacterized RDD family membrane protein YckC